MILRQAIVDRFGDIPDLAALQFFLRTILAAGGSLVLDGEVWVNEDGEEQQSEEGVTQGCPLSMGVYAVASLKELMEADAELKLVGGQARAGADDCYIQGPPAAAMAACKRYAQRVKERLGLDVAVTKCEVYCPDAELQAEVEAWVRDQHEDDPWAFRPKVVSGVECYGVPIGDESFVTEKLKAKVEAVALAATTAIRYLRDRSTQSLWQVLKLSTNVRFDYWLQLAYPSDVLGPAKAIDKVL